MINHARTLLLNKDGVGIHGYVGEEYTPTDFHAVTLPSFCHDVRQVLFGSHPDWLMFSYRAYELMHMLHSTELRQFVLDLDPRITYQLNATTTPFAEVFPFQRDSRGSTRVTVVTEADKLQKPADPFMRPFEDSENNQWWAYGTFGDYESTRSSDPLWSRLNDTFPVTDTTLSSTIFADYPEDDPPSEEDVAAGTGAYEICSVRLSSPGWPTRVGTHTLRYYAAGGPHNDKTTFSLVQGPLGAGEQVVASWIHIPLLIADQEYSRTLTQPQIDRITDYDQLHFRIETWDAEQENLPSAFVYAAELEVPIAATIPEAGIGHLFPMSKFDVPDLTGKCFKQWLLELTASQLKITHQTPPRRFVLEDVTYTSGLSQLVTLPESPMQVRAEEAPGAVWLLESFARPQRGVGDLEATIANLGEETMTGLFHVGDPEGRTEPWKTFRNLWNDHNETAYRLGAVVLALIYHTHDIWNVD